MAQPFTHSADTLLNFLAQPGRGFFIPYYQRNYSWDEENADKLITDVIGGVKRVLIKPNNSIFLGTIILHDEHNVVTGLHADTPNLLTKVSNVVDGQQRITSVGLLACTLTYTITEMIGKLNSYASSGAEFSTLATDLSNQQTSIRELFCVEIRKAGSQPQLKPLIIRAGDVSSNPVTDQWTLAGNGSDFYRSNTARFTSEFIGGKPLPDIQTDERLFSVLKTFSDRIADELESVDHALAQALIDANNTAGGSLEKFIDYPPVLTNIAMLPPEERATFYSGLFLLAICSFLKNSCHFVVIECQDEDIAFDMFQSLNATGTPLTAFEVFKPLIVKEYEANYTTLIKSEVDRIEKVFAKENTASGKEELTDKVIGSSALIYDGSVISNKFSEERDWLIDTFPLPPSQITKDFISCIACQAEYRDHFIRPRKSPKNSSSFTLVTYLQNIGLSPQQADMSTLCIFYLRDAGHQFAHTVISVFYAKLLKSQGNITARALAATEFESVCKAMAAFFTLWMGGFQGRFPDATYRKLFQSAPNISVVSGAANQTDIFVKDFFRDALQSEGIYDSSDAVRARQLWIQKAKANPWYSKKAVCRFALFVSAHDAAPDLMPGNEGLFTDGMTASATMLNCRSWHSSNYEVIEHVATRDQPSVIKFHAHFDASIYPGNKSEVDKIGNLTLLSAPVNSSVYSEWPDKVFYYWSLTTPQITVHGPTGTTLQSSLSITTLPPSLSTLTAASNYLSHLAPLAHRGVAGLKWDKGFIDRRSEHLCERVFDIIDTWLR
ncbi:MAG: DUF262 domain-containing protein [Pseudohongiella sp.]|nr:DUF262 domain-containing protein [Pseudohongiella sp.]